MAYSDSCADLVLALSYERRDPEDAVSLFLDDMMNELKGGEDSYPKEITEQLIQLANEYIHAESRDERRATLIKLAISADRVDAFLNADRNYLPDVYRLEIGEDGMIRKGLKAQVSKFRRSNVVAEADERPVDRRDPSDR